METVDLDALTLAPGTVVLDLGCGEGRHAIAVHAREPAAVVIGLDLNRADLQRAASKAAPYQVSAHLSWVHGDGTGLPLAAASVDVVICSEVLEHLHDYPALLAELVRVLKPGGQCAVSVPRYWPERLCWRLAPGYHQVPGGHVRIFRERELRRALAAVGLRPWRRHWAHALHSPYWWLQCWRWEQREHSALVRAYRRLLEWDLLQRPWLTRGLEWLLNPVLGKSLVLYCRKE